MPRPLFVYGTLRDPDVLELVLGRVLAGAAATAPGPTRMVCASMAALSNFWV